MQSQFGEYEKLSEGIRTVKELPHEMLKVDGSPVDCSVLEVEYDLPERKPEEQNVKYWIDTKRHIVLKEEFSDSNGTTRKTVLWHWVYQVDSVKLNQPPPEWFTELLNKRPDAGHYRPDWVGRDAPPFSLLDLNGRGVTLAEKRAKVLVLNSGRRGAAVLALLKCRLWKLSKPSTRLKASSCGESRAKNRR